MFVKTKSVLTSISTTLGCERVNSIEGSYLKDLYPIVGMTCIAVPLFTDHAEEVRAIIQRAAKDVAIESSLKTYEEVWLSKIFELKAHTRMKGPTSATAATQDVSTQFCLFVLCRQSCQKVLK